MLEHPSATRERLLELAGQVRGARVGIKIAALLLMLDGHGAGRIARALGLTRMSLCRWTHGVNAEGIEILLPKMRPGRPTALTPKIRRQIATHLKRSPRDFALDRDQWDGIALVAHLKQRFGISLKVRQAQNWLHRLGYRSGTETNSSVTSLCGPLVTSKPRVQGDRPSGFRFTQE